jgi:flagellar biosynthesis protein FlhG
MAPERHARRLAVLSGKGGVGKTFVTANMAAEMAARGLRVLVLDANLGPVGMDVAVGARANRTLTDFIRGIASLENVVIPSSGGFDLVPAGSGILEGTVLTPALAYKIEHALRLLEDRYDVIVFDLGSGTVDVVLYFARLAHDVLLVLTPEPGAIADACTVIKVLTLRYARDDFGIVINQASPQRPEHEGMKVANKLHKLVERLLIKEGHPGVQLHLMACIATDPAVPESIGRRQILSRTADDSAAARAIRKLAGNYGPNGFIV